MRKILKTILILISSILLLIIGFYLWAQMPTLSTNKYAVITKHNDTKINTDSTLRILTYNIGYLSGMTNNLSLRASESLYSNNMLDLLDNLKSTEPDIIAFQEIDFNSQRSYFVDQNKKIADDLFSYSALCVNWDKNYVPFPYWPIEAHFGEILSGQSIVSKFVLSDHKRLKLESVKSNPFYYNAFYLSRLAQIVKVDHPIKPFYIINIHVEAFDKETRRHQLKYILDIVDEKSKSYPVILLGDFNSDPFYDNTAMDMFFDNDKLGCTALNKDKLLLSYPSNTPIERLDYLFYTKKDFSCIEADVLIQYGEISDHLPLFSVLKFNK